jgi:hemoglobin
MEEKSLYARIGGYDVMAAVVDELLQSLSSDPRMARFSVGMNIERRRRNRQLTLDYLCAAAGGPSFYIGQDMKTAHTGLGITESDWRVAMHHVERALSKCKMPDRESKELVALIDGLRDQILEV